MNASWPYVVLQASVTLADMLQQSEFLVNIRFISSEGRFSQYAKIKEEISPFLLTNGYTFIRVFLRKMLGTQCGPVGNRFLWF